MPKAGSGFMKAAARAANSIQRGSPGSWRLGSPGDYTEDIKDVYGKVYRNRHGIHFDRNGRGEITQKHVSRTALMQIKEVADKIAKDVQVYNEDAAKEYSRMRDVWSRPVRTNSEEMREIRRGIQSGDTMLINPRGRRTDSDALTRAREAGWHTDQVTNQGVLLEANRMMNAKRSAIWQKAGKVGMEEAMSADIFEGLLKGYINAERAGYRARRKK